MTNSPGVTYTYDKDVTMITVTTGSGTTTYTYDYENRLTNVEVGGTVAATYTYDAFGRCIGIDDGGTQTWTVYNGESADANPYADITSSGTLKMRYLDGLAVDELLARTDASGNKSWYFHDQVGSVIAIASTAAGVQDEIIYDPFGNIVAQTDSAEADRFMFAGMEYDATTGYYYDDARYYDAAIGRFVSQDPKSFAAGDTNLYRYVRNEPTAIADYSGEQPPYDAPIVYNVGGGVGFWYGGGRRYPFVFGGGSVGRDPYGSVGGGAAITSWPPTLQYQPVYTQPIYGWRTSPEHELPLVEPPYQVPFDSAAEEATVV
jgi:RHS repeat-associated protein